MEIVARYLVAEAKQLAVVADRDQFGRSAFNRYYYAAFLLVRSELKPVIGSWPRAHLGIPEWLRATVVKGLNRGIKEAKRADDREAERLCESAKAAALGLSSLMEQGYQIRVVADYDPEVPVEFGDEGDFALNTVHVEEAKMWPHKAGVFAKTIATAWRHIDD